MVARDRGARPVCAGRSARSATEPPIEDLLMAYSRLMEHPDPAIRARTADEWLAWEDAVISMESNGAPGLYSNRSGSDSMQEALDSAGDRLFAAITGQR
jgi:hypothetical protein